MEVNQQNDIDIEIDLKEVVLLIWRKKIVIVLTGMILAMLAVLATKLFITPKYQSTTEMYVLSKQSQDNLTSGDLQTSTLLTQDYVELIKTRTVTEAVIDELGLNIKHEDLIGKMEVVALDNTRIIRISVVDEDPYMARDIANAVRDAAASHIKEVMNIEAVNVADMANIPEEKYSPSIMKNGLAAGVLGCVVCVVLILLRDIGNDTIRTSEDVEKYLRLSVLGTIPLDKKSRRKNK